MGSFRIIIVFHHLSKQANYMNESIYRFLKNIPSVKCGFDDLSFFNIVNCPASLGIPIKEKIRRYEITAFQNVL